MAKSLSRKQKTRRCLRTPASSPHAPEGESELPEVLISAAEMLFLMPLAQCLRSRIPFKQQKNQAFELICFVFYFQRSRILTKAYALRRL